ncbi:MAG TPA: histidine ammonia-lyase [Lentisphaeria bacterium]|nr:MAG: histidine ammonia-lyase [Lentisphaerae bacterium GWF2_38_69]HBM16797.1 histidine ammonia-lyase [Lentisphaeria bacterium]
MVILDGNTLKIEDVFNVALKFEEVSLCPEAEKLIKASSDCVERLVKSGKTVYGITTGFGDLANKTIPPDEVEKLQLNLVRSHSVGVGTPFSEKVVRGIILLRINALAKGYSGVRLTVINTLIALLNKGIYPYIPSQGSVGASGDLAPLAHLALAIVGEGECLVGGKRFPSKGVMLKKGIEPVVLKAKEGLGLTNGTQAMASLGCLSVYKAKRLIKNAQIATAMSVEALKGTTKAFDERIHALRPHAGQVTVAENLRNLLAGSEIISSHRDCSKVQDAYTLRCYPQVTGAVLDAINYVESILSIEINSANDNPLIFADQDEAISGGNFHGEPLALALDYLGMAVSELSNISERLIDRLVNPYKSGLPGFLTRNGGINSGFMIVQYTAAALVSENKVLSHPASVDSIPTSAGQEDHVSMGTISCRHALDIIDNTENVVAIQLLTAAQGMDFWDMSPGTGTKVARDEVRKYISFMDEDRILYKDMEIARKLVDDRIVLKAVEKVIKLK